MMFCGQDEIMGESCLSCGGWIHREVRDGYTDGNFRYCSEECIADQQQYEKELEEQRARLQ